MKNIFALLILISPTFSYGELMSFSPIKNIGFYDSSSFSWEESGKQYKLNAEGALILKSASPLDGRKIQLPIDPFIVQVFIRNDKSDMFLALETDFAGDGGGYVCKVKSDLSSTDWCKSIPAINLKAMATKDSIWLAAYAFVGKLDAKSGKLSWFHNNLNQHCEMSREDSWTSHWSIEDVGAEIIFYSEHANPSNERRLVVNPTTGKIISCTQK